MSDPGAAEKRAAPVVVRVGGGVSARVWAIVVVVVLVGVVWIGMSGRPVPPSAATGTPLAAGIQGSEATAPETVPTPPDGPSTTPPQAVAFDPGDIFGVAARLGDSQFITILNEGEPGRLSGRLNLPFTAPGTEGTIELLLLTAFSAPGQPVSIGDWALHLDRQAGEGGREYVVLDEFQTARPQPPDTPRPVQRGFRIEVRAQGEENFRVLRIAVWIGAGPLPERRPRFGNVCRWDAPPPATLSGPDRDEANCA